MVIRNAQRIFVVFFVALSLARCGEKSPSLVPLDLLSHGLPLKIQAPENAEVKFDDMGIIKDMTIRGDENFNIQIYATEANTLDINRVVNELKETVEKNTFFSKIIEEDDNGFLFEKKIDDDYVNYDFRYVKIRGDQKYVFQTLVGGKYTADDVRRMYKAVQ